MIHIIPENVNDKILQLSVSTHVNELQNLEGSFGVRSLRQGPQNDSAGINILE